MDKSVGECTDLPMDDGFQFLEQHVRSVLHGADLLLAGVLGLTPLDHVVEALVEFAQSAWVGWRGGGGLERGRWVGEGEVGWRGGIEWG